MVSSASDSADDVAAIDANAYKPVKHSIFRSVPFQIAVACGVSFTAPGMWDALGGLGAGGAAEPYAVSAANALVYGLFAIFCVAAGAVNNRIGLRYGLALGAIGYPLYGAGLYTNNVTATTWFMLFGSALCGISAGFFWAAEAAIIIGYPSPQDRAFYLAIWQTAKAAGPIVGGAINLGLNAQKSGTGSVSSATYIVFIVIMCLGLPISLCLSPAEKVWRKDGTRVVIRKEPTWKAEFKAVGTLFISRRILLLLPAFFISYFYNGFLSTWLTVYFTVRSRAFSSFFTNFSGIFSSFIIASLLDRQSIHIKKRAKIAFSAIITILVGTWIWATILQKQFYDAPESPVFDWFQGGFGKSYALVFFWTFAGQAFQQFLYWLVGQYTTDLSSLSHHTGILRGVEALGQTVAWAMQTGSNVNHFVSIGINFGFTILCIIPTWIVLSELERTHEIKVTEFEVQAESSRAVKTQNDAEIYQKNQVSAGDAEI
ncbi:major facilitator superfamily domain-containing protein [Biscogniauxia mediterranea]|nr:major facilitator superfamily domain-containing protein [Biscogniauxia mediterranea]